MKRLWLIRLRKSRRLTQELVATGSFIDRGFYAQIENGTRDPSIHVATNIARVLGIHPRIFFSEVSNNHAGDQVIFTQSDLNLRYTWAYCDDINLDHVIGSRDDELGDEPGLVSLYNLKRAVLLDSRPVEQIISLPRGDVQQAFLVRGEPLLLAGNKLEGVFTILTQLPAITRNFSSDKALSLDTLAKGSVLYFYDSQDAYLNHLVRFVSKGLQRKSDIVLFESVQTYAMIERRLKLDFSSDELQQIQLIEQGEEGLVLSTISHPVETYQWSREGPLVWANVQSRLLENSISPLWEDCYGASVAHPGGILVCAVDANTVSAHVQTMMMRNHPYFMTDSEFVHSPLFAGNPHSFIFPPIFRQV